MGRKRRTSTCIFKDIKKPEDCALINAILTGFRKKPSILKPRPKRLFQYKSLTKSYVLQQIENSTIHLSTPANFNDPFDSVFAKSMFYSSVENVLTRIGLPIVESYFNDVYQQIADIKKELRISCFTESNRDIKMWAYYADAHEGICIEYNIEEYRVDINNNTLKLFPIFYTNQLQNLLEYSKQLHIDKIRFKFTPEIVALMALCKLKIWQDEKEWRIVERTDSFYEDFLIIPISAIYLGMNISSENKEKVLEIAKKKKIPCYQMEVSHRELAIVPQKVSLT